MNLGAAARALRCAGISRWAVEEVEQVDPLSRIHGAPEQPSWNLAQAVAIYACEARAAALQPRRTASRIEADPAALATVDRALAGALSAAGKPGARRRLFKSLERARLSPREAALSVALLTAKKNNFFSQRRRVSPRGGADF